MNYLDTFKDRFRRDREEFLKSLKSFKDINDTNLDDIIDYFGFEGHNSIEDAKSDLLEKLEFYKKMPDPVILYRVVGLGDGGDMNFEKLGNHWTPHNWLLDGDLLMSIGFDTFDEDLTPYIIKASVKLSDISVSATLSTNLSFPNEHEVFVRDGADMEIISIKEMI